MRYTLLLVLAAVLVLGVAGCQLYRTPVMPPAGVIVSNLKAPLSADNNGVTVTAAKKGSATVENYLGIISVGDCSINAAADKGDLKTVSYADYEYFNVLGVYQKFTVNVYGN